MTQALSSSASFSSHLPSVIALTKWAAVSALTVILTACGAGSSDGGSAAATQPTTPANPATPAPSVWSIGTGSGSSFKAGAIETSQTTLQSGETATLRVNIVNQRGEAPTTAFTVTFASSCAATGLATFSAATTVNPGLYSVDYSNKGCDRQDTVTATLASDNKTATVAIRMVGPEALTVSFVSSSQTQLSLAGIGGNESAELIFKVAGAQGVPVVGKEVQFSVNTRVGGAAILKGRETGITDQSGQVRTVLNSGTVAGPVNVLAVHKESGRQGVSSDIVISTGVPSANYFSLSTSVTNTPDAYKRDGVQVTITVLASDAFGNNPVDGTRVSFVSPEGGNVQNSCQLANGTCSVIWRSSSPRPADGRVQVLAYTDGAEGFVDNNGNSVYDSADGAIDDLSEPYSDNNENERYDTGEFFFDTNRNSVRDRGNGKWDGPCLVKVDPRAVCAGEPTVTIFGNVTIVMSQDDATIIDLGTFPSPGQTINMVQGTSTFLGFMFLGDELGNPLPAGTKATFTVEGGGVKIQGSAAYTVPSNAKQPTGAYGVALAADPVTLEGTLPTNVKLILTVDVPSTGVPPQQSIWPINITR